MTGRRRIKKLVKVIPAILSSFSLSGLEQVRSEVVHAYRTRSFPVHWHPAPSPKE